jgi:hypothetical protein
MLAHARETASIRSAFVVEQMHWNGEDWVTAIVPHLRTYDAQQASVHLAAVVLRSIECGENETETYYRIAQVPAE